jgi:hypothetical protein
MGNSTGKKDSKDAGAVRDKAVAQRVFELLKCRAYRRVLTTRAAPYCSRCRCFLMASRASLSKYVPLLLILNERSISSMCLLLSDTE